MMRIVTLMENTPGKEGCAYEHGLSFYIETPKHCILMDTGATDAFARNAKLLGVDLKKVDLAVLSHGHYDHAGGILTFAKINPDAPVYMQKNAGKDYYSVTKEEERYIGIDKKILTLPQLKIIEGNLEIDGEIFLFSGIKGRKYFARGNQRLKCKTDETFYEDTFDHEQCMVVRCEGKSVLFSGCAHNGIINILEVYEQLFGNTPDVVITGFHMMQKQYDEHDIENIKKIARELKKTGTIYYSGHCTGEYAFGIMKEIMGEKLMPLHSGNVISI